MTTRQTAAILFADIAGSSRLYKSVGDDRAQALIIAVIVEMSALVEDHQGTIIKTIGDEIMASFDTAEASIRAAMAIQRRRSQSEPRLDARIGTHFGPTLVQGGDVFGEAVNDAAHLVRIARGGQIVTSADTVGALPEELKSRATRFDRIPFKGSLDPTVIYLVDWSESADPASRAGPATEVLTAFMELDVATVPATLVLRYQDREIAIGPEDVPYVVGRDPGLAALPVLSNGASRDHLHIEYRRGKFVLRDNSTNGTWVHVDGHAEPIYLRREEAPLTGAGTISIGRAISEDDPHLIRFSL